MSESKSDLTELEKYRSYVKSRLDSIARIGVSASEGDFSDEIELSGHDDEFTQLYTGIKVMVDAMRAQLREFRELNQTLEENVAKRTTQLAQSEARHRAISERYALAAAGTNEGLWDWNIDTGEIYYSLRWSSILGCNPGLIGTDSDEWFSRVHREDLSSLLGAVYEHIEGSAPHFESEHRMLRSDGSYVWVLSRGIALREEGHAYRMAGSMTDISARKKIEEQLIHNAFHDDLTGLPNRALFMDRLRHSIKRSMRRESRPCAVLFIDLDQFKIVNDSLGHLAGDQLLVAFTIRLQRCVRPGDTVARLGGDEFVVLLEDVSELPGALVVADRIIASMKEAFEVSGQEFFVTASIGVVGTSLGYERPEEILRDADAAMYRAKSRGRDQYHVFESSIRSNVISRLSLDRELRQAIDRGAFQVHYQPIVSLETGTIAGFEALVRWEHPGRGVVLPSEFVPLAEETGLILPIGRFVLEESCRQTNLWNKKYDARFQISVNLSPRQFDQTDLPQHVEKTLFATGLPAEDLCLEITEGIIIRSSRTANQTLQDLRAMGVGVSLDDFGTGYSSLSYLNAFPITALKVDRSFVSNVENAGKHHEIVRSIVDLGRKLGLTTIAEGVETMPQARALKGLSCARAQGYLFAKPIPASDIERLLETDQAKSWSVI